MPYAIVRDIPTNWEDYRQATLRSSRGVPRGLLIHVAGRTSEGVREIEVWSSHGDVARYERRRARHGDATPTTRELDVELVVLREERQ